MRHINEKLFFIENKSFWRSCDDSAAALELINLFQYSQVILSYRIFISSINLHCIALLFVKNNIDLIVIRMYPKIRKYFLVFSIVVRSLISNIAYSRSKRRPEGCLNNVIQFSKMIFGLLFSGRLCVVSIVNRRFSW